MTVSNQIISAVLDSVDDNLKLEIKGWSKILDNDQEEDDNVASTYEGAKVKGDFIWVFEAAHAVVYKIQQQVGEQDIDIDMKETVEQV